MPRPPLRPDAALWLAAAVGCAALGPAALHAALAAAAGTLFEAAPFVLAAELAPKRLGLLAAVTGCGCGRRAPGTLSLPATALCWIAFGPLVTVARLAAGAVLLLARRHARSRTAVTSSACERDAMDELLALAPCAALAVTLASALGRSEHHLGATLAGRASLFALGCLLGAVAPCATAAVATAAALRSTFPAAATGVLVCGGLVSLVASNASLARPAFSAPDRGRIDWSRIALALALGSLCARGASGFINPRLLPFVAAGAPFALLGARRPTRSRNAAFVPALLLVALYAGSPAPSETANATRLDEAYPGERLAFVGRAHRSESATVLERSIITCCRADASAIALRLSSPLDVADGTWIAAAGTIARSNDGLVLQPARWHAIEAPADPFLYR